jgi:hypothetical protein
MALQSLSGQGIWLPNPPQIQTLSFTSSVIDATGEKFAWIGRVWTPDRGSKSIRNVWFNFGSVTKAGGSALTVSLQDVSTAAGAPIQPDETQDQTVAIANADAGFTSNAGYTTGNFSADRNVSFGDMLAVVAEYDGSGRLGADAVNFRNVTKNLFGGMAPIPGCSLKTASWAGVTAAPNIILVFSDGTFGTLSGAFPCLDVNVLAFKQDTAGSDEYAIEIPIAWDCKAEGFWAVAGATATTADWEFVLYDGTSPMTGGTVTNDGMWISAAAETRLIEHTFSQEIELAAGTTYRLAMKPTQTTNTCRMGYFDVGAAGHMGVHPLGTGCVLTSRLDLGSWAAVTATRRPLMGLRVSALDDGAGGGGNSNPHLTQGLARGMSL